MGVEWPEFLTTPDVHHRMHQTMLSQIRHDEARALAEYKTLSRWRRPFKRRPRVFDYGGYTARMVEHLDAHRRRLNGR